MSIKIINCGGLFPDKFGDVFGIPIPTGADGCRCSGWRFEKEGRRICIVTTPNSPDVWDEIGTFHDIIKKGLGYKPAGFDSFIASDVATVQGSMFDIQQHACASVGIVIDTDHARPHPLAGIITTDHGFMDALHDYLCRKRTEMNGIDSE